MIRICYVVDAPFLGGAEMYVSRLAGALDRRRFEPVVMMRAGLRDPHLDGWVEILRADEIRVIETPMRMPLVLSDALAMWRRLDAAAPDVVHVNVPGPYDGQMGCVLPLAKAAGARTVVTEHLPMAPYLWKRAAVKRLTYRWLDVAVTMTRANARFLCDRQGVAPAKVRVVPNGVDAGYGASPDEGRSRRWALGLRDSQVVIVYVGNIFPHKGLRRLIEAVSRCRNRDRLGLVVAGDGHDEAACRQMASDRGISGQVMFLGRRDAVEVEALLAAGDVLALPSTIEGMPYVLLEAMASRLPVVAGRVYGIPEVVEDGVTGLLVDPLDTGEIAAALDRIADDPLLRRAMGAAGRARVEREFTLEGQARAMESIYRALVHGTAERGREPA